MKAGIQKTRKAIQILTVSAYFYNLENAEVFERDSVDKELCHKKQVCVNDFFSSKKYILLFENKSFSNQKS